MTQAVLFSNLFRFLLYIGTQIVIFKFLSLFDVAFCYVYIGFIFMLQKELSHSNVILLSFLAGVMVDSFYNTFGIHAAACTFIAYLRPFVLSYIAPQSGNYEDKTDYTLNTLGFLSYALYVGILTLIHHFIIFFLEMGSFQMFFFTLLKVICSFLFTIIMLFVYQMARR